MTERAARTFSYRADRGSYWSIAGVFLGLGLLEGGGILAVILRFSTSPAWKWGLASALLLLFLAVPARILFATLFTAHRLGPETLTLHFGRHRFEIPRRAIARATPVRQPLAGFEPLGARRDERRNGIVAVFSEAGQILLDLDPPQAYRLGPFDSGRAVDHLLFNVDQPEALLAELGGDAVAAPVRGPARRPESVPPDAPEAVRAPAPAIDAPVRIETVELTRTFGGLTAIAGVSLAVRRGEVYGFLGLNGAGKTTAIKMLVGLLEPSSGAARIAGHDVWRQPVEAKAAFGYVPDRAILYDRLTGREHLRFLAQVRGLERRGSEARIEELLAELDLERHADAACGSYSLGMKRKLSLAAAMLHRPPVLLLDEPFNGLDPRSSHRLKAELARRSAETAIFLSTHDLATAEAVCHRVGILHRGRLIAEGAPAELRAAAAGSSSLEGVFLELTREEPAEAVG